MGYISSLCLLYRLLCPGHGHACRQQTIFQFGLSIFKEKITRKYVGYSWPKQHFEIYQIACFQAFTTVQFLMACSVQKQQWCSLAGALWGTCPSNWRPCPTQTCYPTPWCTYIKSAQERVARVESHSPVKITENRNTRYVLSNNGLYLRTATQYMLLFLVTVQ